MFEIAVEETFSSGHALRGYKGKCENPHGHNYRVRVRLRGPKLNNIGLLCDFKELKRMVREETERLDHQFLNDIQPFKETNPSAENLARHLYEHVRSRLGDNPEGVAVAEVTVYETDSTAAVYREG